jgi:anti-sigma regulatory factor (Ser/Thr protein kinase)
VTTGTSTSAQDDGTGFRHEALLYCGDADFVDQVGSFIRRGVEAEEPTLAVVGAAKIDLLRQELGRDAEAVTFADMAVVGCNPARIIPAWRDFVREYARPGRRLRGVGEPVFPSRTPPELVECQRHESLLNLAFTDSPAWWLVCPYDTAALDAEVIAEARKTHPVVTESGVSRLSVEYAGLEPAGAPFQAPLPEPGTAPTEFRFDSRRLHELRRWVAAHARAGGLDERRTADVVLAVNELATNSIRHAEGDGMLLTWWDGESFMCEVRDPGVLADPLAGRVRPADRQASGYGLWLVNHLCDLVQIRTFPSGNAIRLMMRRATA